MASGGVASALMWNNHTSRFAPCLKPFGPATQRREECEQALVERVMGIEPTLVAWEATVLPLNYTRCGAGFYVTVLRDAARPPLRRRRYGRAPAATHRAQLRAARRSHH